MNKCSFVQFVSKTGPKNSTNNLTINMKANYNFYTFLQCILSYVQWAESGGARVVPVIIGKDRPYYEQVQ